MNDSNVLENAVKKLYVDLLEAWNARSAERFARLFAADGSSVGFDGSPMNGRAEIEGALSEIFAHHPTAAYVAKLREIRSLAPGAVLLRAVAGMVPPGKDDIKAETNAIQTLIAVGKPGALEIALFQNTPAAFHGRPASSQELTDELRAVFRKELTVDSSPGVET